MGGKRMLPHVPRPSPLAQVSHTRPLSQAPTDSGQGLVRDPMFWKRFSVAVHASETDPFDEESGNSSKTSLRSGATQKKRLEEDGWLSQQAKERRRCRTCCIIITLIAITIIAGAAFCGWYFTKVHPVHLDLKIGE